MKMPACLRCGEAMKEGFTFDSAGVPNAWMAGIPQKGLKHTKGPKPLYVTTLRCPKCGYLESYAPPA